MRISPLGLASRFGRVLIVLPVVDHRQLDLGTGGARVGQDREFSHLGG
jgi:hypothetical protein